MNNDNPKHNKLARRRMQSTYVGIGAVRQYHPKSRSKYAPHIGKKQIARSAVP